jgi:hypothetical protein
MKMTMLMMRRLVQSAAVILACAVAACSGTEGDDSVNAEMESSDVAAPNEEVTPAQNADLSPGELGKAEQALCKCQGFEGEVSCSTTGADFPYLMCNGPALNRARAACGQACPGGSCVIHPASNC